MSITLVWPQDFIDTFSVTHISLYSSFKSSLQTWAKQPIWGIMELKFLWIVIKTSLWLENLSYRKNKENIKALQFLKIKCTKLLYFSISQLGVTFCVSFIKKSENLTQFTFESWIMFIQLGNKNPRNLFLTHQAEI